jgi:hypothetical protein
VYVRADCTDVSTEIDCADTGGDDVIDLFELAAGAPISIIVDSFDAAAAGTYDLDVEELAVLAAGAPCTAGSTTAVCDPRANLVCGDGGTCVDPLTQLCDDEQTIVEDTPFTVSPAVPVGLSCPFAPPQGQLFVYTTGAAVSHRGRAAGAGAPHRDARRRAEPRRRVRARQRRRDVPREHLVRGGARRHDVQHRHARRARRRVHPG